MLFRYYSGRSLAFAITLCGPCVLVLSYLAVGGDIPLRWRQKGYHRIMLVAVVFWASFLAAFTFAQVWPPSGN